MKSPFHSMEEHESLMPKPLCGVFQ